MPFPKSLFNVFIVFILLSGALSAQTENLHEAWQKIQRPPVGKGLFMEPRMLGMGSRLHLVWTGTSSIVNVPELFHASIKGNDTEWRKPQAPFFGRNKGRVRKLAIGRTRNLIGILFQRTLTQGHDAYEVLLAISTDQGWSWSNTIEIDQYVAEKTGGTAVSIEGRQGANRPEFALSWIRENSNVRVANFDISSQLRPQGVLVGQHASGADRSEVGTLGKKGFSVVYNNGAGLATAYVKGLVGRIDEGVTFLRGRYGSAFSVASRPYGPSRLAVGIGDSIEAFTSHDVSWKNDNQTAKLPFSISGCMMEADMDGKKNLHIGIVRPADGKFELWYLGQKKGKWGKPELVCTLADNLDIRGFDLATTDDLVYAAVSQGFEVNIVRRKI